MKHLYAMDELARALQQNASGPEIPALEDAVRVCCLDRENRVARYENHLATHELKVMTAGSPLT